MKTLPILLLFSFAGLTLAYSQSAAVYGGNFADGDYENNAAVGAPSNSNLSANQTSIIEILNPNAPGQVLGFAEITYLGGNPGGAGDFNNLRVTTPGGGPTNPHGFGTQFVGLNLQAGAITPAEGSVRVRLFINNNRTTFNGLSLVSRAGALSPDRLTINTAQVLGQDAMAGAAGGFNDGNRREILNYVDDGSDFNGADDLDNGAGTATGLIDDGINATNTPAFTTPAVSAQNGLGVGDTLEFLRNRDALPTAQHANEWAVNMGLDWGGGPSRYSFGQVAEFEFSYLANANGQNLPDGTNVFNEALGIIFDITVAPEPSSALLGLLGGFFGFSRRQRVS